jgi:hypothetical protein
MLPISFSLEIKLYAHQGRKQTGLIDHWLSRVPTPRPDHGVFNRGLSGIPATSLLLPQLVAPTKTPVRVKGHNLLLPSNRYLLHNSKEINSGSVVGYISPSSDPASLQYLHASLSNTTVARDVPSNMMRRYTTTSL